MKKAAKAKGDPDMLAEYDFSQGVRGKYANDSRGRKRRRTFARCCGILSRLRGSESAPCGLWSILLAGARRSRSSELRGEYA